MRDKRCAVIITSVNTEEQNSILYEGRFEKTMQYVFNSNFGLYFRQKKYKIQSKNIIMRCEFDAKMHPGAQNIKRF